MRIMKKMNKMTLDYDEECEKFLESLYEYSEKNKQIVTINKDILKKLYSENFKPEFFQSMTDFSILKKILLKLEDCGKIVLPKGKEHYDNSTTIRLPNWIKLIIEKQKKQDKPWLKQKWHPSLLWILDVHHMKEEISDILLVLDFFLKELPSSIIPIPEKERSLQIFGDEKILRMLMDSFPEQDFCNIARCYRTYEPLIGITFKTSESRVIFIENRDTFLSVCKVNSLLTPPPFLGVYYGQGYQFLTSILSIPLKFDPEVPIEYFGDIDHHGFAIPDDALAILKKYHPNYKLVLAKEFYEHLVKLYEHQDYIFKNRSKKRKFDHSWLELLSDHTKIRILQILEKDQRVPQELLNIVELYKMMSGKKEIPPKLSLNHEKFMRELFSSSV
ncbi:MAG: Wadjet anti-phage system protein JetD domain-containing protein [Candidatus Hodarchaeota archaeon]